VLRRDSFCPTPSALPRTSKTRIDGSAGCGHSHQHGRTVTRTASCASSPLRPRGPGSPAALPPTRRRGQTPHTWVRGHSTSKGGRWWQAVARQAASPNPIRLSELGSTAAAGDDGGGWVGRMSCWRRCWSCWKRLGRMQPRREAWGGHSGLRRGAAGVLWVEGRVRCAGDAAGAETGDHRRGHGHAGAAVPGGGCRWR
jgi:hypothetical protein